jgi:diamine N-acetyltransferase
MIQPSPSFRIGTAADAEPISALAIQVFLDTYAPDGVRRDLAAEAFAEYGREVFEQRLVEPGRTFHLVERGGGLLGFAEVLCEARDSPISGVRGAELVRLYVQPSAQGRGLGRALIGRAQMQVADIEAGGLWLSAWEGNLRALAFYRQMGYQDVGLAHYTIQGHSYGNRIFHKVMGPRKP